MVEYIAVLEHIVVAIAVVQEEEVEWVMFWMDEEVEVVLLVVQTEVVISVVAAVV
jgi:hypothetical protein